MLNLNMLEPVPGFKNTYISLDTLTVYTKELKPLLVSEKNTVRVVRAGATRTSEVDVYRLLCYVYHGIPTGGNNILIFLDGDPNNASQDNLAWGNRSRQGLINSGVKDSRQLYLWDAVLDPDRTNIRTYQSSEELMDSYTGIGLPTINRFIRGDIAGLYKNRIAIRSSRGPITWPNVEKDLIIYKG